MQLTVEAKSQFGIKCGDKWYNKDKVTNPDISILSKGDTIEADVNGKYIKSFTVIGGGGKPQAQNAAQQKAVYDNEARQYAISRGNACNAVFGSPMLAEVLKNMDHSEAIATTKLLVEETSIFIHTGMWTNE